MSLDASKQSVSLRHEVRGRRSECAHTKHTFSDDSSAGAAPGGSPPSLSPRVSSYLSVSSPFISFTFLSILYSLFGIPLVPFWASLGRPHVAFILDHIQLFPSLRGAGLLYFCILRFFPGWNLMKCALPNLDVPQLPLCAFSLLEKRWNGRPAVQCEAIGVSL